MTYAERLSFLCGQFSALSECIQTDVVIQTLTTEAIRTSSIEGEIINRPDVMSSIINHLNLERHPRRIAELQRGDGRNIHYVLPKF